MSLTPKTVLKKLVAIPNPDGTFRYYRTLEEGAWSSETDGWFNAPGVRDEELTVEQYANALREAIKSSETAALKARDEAIDLRNAAREEVEALKTERDALLGDKAILTNERDAARRIVATFNKAFGNFAEAIGLKVA